MSSLSSLESEVKDLDKAFSATVVEATASGRLVARHMLERASSTLSAPPNSTEVEPALQGEPGEAVQQNEEGQGPRAGGKGQKEPELSMEDLLKIMPEECSDSACR